VGGGGSGTITGGDGGDGMEQGVGVRGGAIEVGGGTARGNGGMKEGGGGNGNLAEATGSDPDKNGEICKNSTEFTELTQEQ
jgi:hypothetical protein